MKNFDKNKFKALMAAIRNSIRCPKCDYHFVDSDVEMVTGAEGAYFIKMQCSNCRVNIIASVVNIGANNNNIPNLDEIDFFFSADRKQSKNKNTSPISFNDILEVHELLEKEEISF